MEEAHSILLKLLIARRPAAELDAFYIKTGLGPPFYHHYRRSFLLRAYPELLEWLVARDIFTVDQLASQIGFMADSELDGILIWFFARRTGAQLKNSIPQWRNMSLAVPYYISRGFAVAVEWILQNTPANDTAMKEMKKHCCRLMDYYGRGRQNPNFFGIADVLVRHISVCPEHNLEHILLNAKPWYNLLTMVVAGRRRKMSLPIELWRYIVTEYSVFTPDEPLPPFDQWWKRQF